MSTAVRRTLLCFCGKRRCFSCSSGFLAAYLHNVHGPAICPSLLPLEYLQETFVHVGGDSCHHPAVSHGEFSTAYQEHSHMFQHLTGFHDTYLYRHDYDSPMTRCLPSCLVEDWLLLANTSLPSLHPACGLVSLSSQFIYLTPSRRLPDLLLGSAFRYRSALMASMTSLAENVVGARLLVACKLPRMSRYCQGSLERRACGFLLGEWGLHGWDLQLL